MIIGLDVGGTHTDAVLIGSAGVMKEVKISTRSSDLFHSVWDALEMIMEEISPEEISRIVLSTTLTTNLVAENRIPPLAMIVSAGPGIDPYHFRTHDDYYVVRGALDHRGREITPIDPDEITALSEKFDKKGIRHIGVVSKFSVRSPIHELEIERLLGKRFERIFLGHRTSGLLNFPRRISTTFLNTAVYPTYRTFFNAVEASLQKKGLHLPLRILKADGGSMPFSASISEPANTLLSGPSASVMGAVAFAPKDKESVVLDIGGTTTDMALLSNGTPLLDPIGIEVGPYKTLIRALKTQSIGVGGDSFVRVASGSLLIGPERKGVPMTFGGFSPTPTDAACVLGYMPCGDRKQAMEGMKDIGSALGLPPSAAAKKVFDKTCGMILEGIRRMVEKINSQPVYTVHEVYKGTKFNPQTLLILGGPAPFFGRRIKELSNFTVEIVPRWKVANAIGAALSRSTADITVYADTHQQILTAPAEDYSQIIPSDFTLKDATEKTLELLREKAIRIGANPDTLCLEVIEKMQFNMVRGFYTTGKNIRVKAQIKPGLIETYDPCPPHDRG